MKLPLILLPAALCDERLYEAILPGLADLVEARCPVIAGRRLTDSAATLLADAPPRFLLGGTSYGAQLALEVALAAPDRVAGLWLMGCNAGRTRLPARGRLVLARLERGEFPIIVSEMAESCIHAPADPDRAARARFGQMARAVGPERLAAQITAMLGRADRRARLGELRMPVQLLWGQDDIVSPPADGETIAAAVRHARFDLVRHCGHLPPLEQPEATFRAARRWVEAVVRPQTALR